MNELQQNNEATYYKSYNHIISKPIEQMTPDKSDNVSSNQNQIKNANSNFKSVLDENQKTIQDFNKEALNEFKNTIMSEIKSPVVVPANEAIKQTTTITPIVNANDAVLAKIEQNNIKLMNLKKDLITSSADGLNEDEMGLNDDLSSISSHNLSDIEDSLEFDALKGNLMRSKSATIATKSVGNNTAINMMTNNTDSFNNQVANIKNHFITKTLTTDFLTNTLLSNKKTYFAPQFNNENEAGDNNTTTNERTTLHRSNTTAKIQQQNNIKSILKRSTSENNLHLMTNNNNFGVKAEKIEVKDSLEVATNRIKGTNNIKELVSAGRKKSVRFANDNEDNDSQVDQNEDSNNDIEIIANTKGVKSAAPQYKRPIVKARSNTVNKKPLYETKKKVYIYFFIDFFLIIFIRPVTQVTFTNDDATDDAKIVDSRPPLPTYAHENSYLVISQKRKEFIEKFRNKAMTGEFLTSPKSANEPSNNKIVNDNQVTSTNSNKHQNNDKVQSFLINNKNVFTETINHSDRLETKKNDNLNTFNNKYGNTELPLPPQQQQQASRHLLARFNTTIPQYVSQNESNFDTTQSTNKRFAQKSLVKAFTDTTSVIEIQQMSNSSNQAQVRRPYSANTPITVENNLMGSNNQNQQIPKINTKLIAFNMNTRQTPQRIFSADSANPNHRYKKYINK